MKLRQTDDTEPSSEVDSNIEAESIAQADPSREDTNVNGDPAEGKPDQSEIRTD